MKSATILVGIFLVIGVSSDNLLPENLLQSIKSCMEELNISEDDYKHAMEKHDFSNPEFHCLSECTMRLTGVMIDKKVDLESVKQLMKDFETEMSDEDLNGWNEKCLEEAQKNEDKCDYAMTYEKCMKETVMDALGLKEE